MNTQEFRHFAKVAVDYIADYFDTIRERGVMHSVQPGYIKKLIPNEAPEKGESWQKLFEDIDRVIMPGLTHWHSPNFHAYFAAANSFPAVVGEMMAAGFTSIGLDWTASPVCTELEAEMMDWLAKLLGLPQYFLNSSPGSGGGVLQTSASEATFLCLLAAREKKVQEMLVRYPYISEATVRSKLVAYSSDQSNSSVEKAGLLSGIPLRLLPSDSHGRLEGSTLVEAIMRDKCNGLIPFYVVACLGTTPTCAFDKLSEIGPVCLQESIWIHVDAAYAGAALSCPEYSPVLSSVEPGYLSSALPETPPQTSEKWQKVFTDVDKLILPGLTHWHSPNFHAYFPTANSFPGIVGELMLSGLGCLSKDWESNPACIELEVRVMDWLCKMLGLPKEFLNESEGPGGGVIQNAASESTLVGLLCGREKSVRTAVANNRNTTPEEIRGKLVAYTSKESNSSVEKASLLASVPMRLLPTDEGCRLRGHTLREAIERDKVAGLIPCCVVASLGTTGTCAIDDLEELGVVCQENNVWLHVDAAYAGAALVCPEYRYLMKGIEYTDSFNFNPHKWFLTNSDCSAMWFRNTKDAEEAFKVKNSIPQESQYEPEIEYWQIPSCRRFRALKLWFVMRIYGVQGIQKHIRLQIGLAKYFERLVRSDERYEVLISCLGVVCFRLKGDDVLTQNLLDRISERRNLFIMPYYIQSKLVVRFVVCSRLTEKEDIDYAWNEIVSLTPVIKAEAKNVAINKIRRKLALTKTESIVNKGLVCDINDKLKVELFL